VGDRASYAIREGGHVELFYGQFGAGALLADIFWGPTTCEAMIREQEESDRWLDDVFGEAAVAMCKDTKKVAFHDSRYSRDTQLLAAKLMRELWPGWRVGAVRYVSGVAATLGVDLRDRERPTKHFVSDLVDLDHVCRRNFMHHALLEVVGGGQRERRMIGTPLHRHLWHGPRLLEAVRFLPTIADVRAGVASRLDRHGERTSLIDHRAGIATIDVDRKTLDVTYLPNTGATHAYGFTGAAAERWPGWTVRRYIGSASEHFARLGLTADADLELAAPQRPVGDMLRELAHGLFATEANKEHASEWLEQVLGWDGNLVSHPLSADDRLMAFRKAIATLDLHDIARGNALRRARGDAPPKDPKTDLELGPWKREWSLAVRRLDDGTVLGIARPTKRPPVILRWTDTRRPPEITCTIVDAPCPGYASFEVAPSGRACIALLSREKLREVYWIDLVTGTVKRIAESSPVGYLSPETRFVFSPQRDRDRVAWAVGDERALRDVGEHVVVVYDGAEGYIGEHPGVDLGEWTPSGLTVRRAELVGGTYALRTLPFTSTASRALVHARMLGDAPGVAEREVRARAAVVESARRARDAERTNDVSTALSALELDPASTNAFDVVCSLLSELGDHERLRAAAFRHIAARPDTRRGWSVLAQAHVALREPREALRAGVRAVELAPFHPEAHLARAAALSAIEDRPGAIEACVRALECDRKRLDEVRTLLELDDHPDVNLDLTRQWRALCPDVLDAWLLHAGARIDANDPVSARRSVEELVAHWPSEYTGHLMLARLDSANAMRHLKRAADVAVDARALDELLAIVDSDEVLAPLARELQQMLERDA
jgi:tetratricopeptide (TPR) repeat protein